MGSNVTETRGRMGASVRFDGRTVTVVRTSYSLGARGELSIPVGQIGVVVWKRATWLTHGWIGFTAPGMLAAPNAALGMQGAAALKDPWTVCFTRRHEADFAALRVAIDQARSRASA